MLGIALVLLSALPALASDWPQFRGPTGDGHYTGPPLPIEWGPKTTVAWQTPILVDGRLVFSVDAPDKQAVVALDPKTGETAWETPRKHTTDRPFSFGTPTVVEVGGKKQIVSEGSDILAGYDAKTGKEIWRIK